MPEQIPSQSRLQQFDHFWATITPRELEEFEIKPCVAAAAGTRHKFEAMWLIDEEDIEFNRSHIHNVGTFACGLVDQPALQDEEWTVSWLAEGDLSDIEIIDRDVPVAEPGWARDLARYCEEHTVPIDFIEP